MVIASNKLNEIAQYSFFMKGGSKEKSIDGVFFFDRKSGYESNNLTTAATAFDDSNLTTVDIGEKTLLLVGISQQVTFLRLVCMTIV